MPTTNQTTEKQKRTKYHLFFGLCNNWYLSQKAGGNECEIAKVGIQIIEGPRSCRDTWSHNPKSSTYIRVLNAPDEMKNMKNQMTQNVQYKYRTANLTTNKMK